MIYKKEQTTAISFPLGGIGTGSIGLAGNGSLIDWEINNRPNRESINSFTNFAIKAETDTEVVDGRLLQGDITSGFMGNHVGDHSWGYGHGPNRGTMAGLKHFEHTSFTGEFPIATINYHDHMFPGEITLTALNPFIPGNSDDSSIPVACFSFAITNTTDTKLTYTLGCSLTNPLWQPGKHSFTQINNLSAITMQSKTRNPRSTKFGNVTVATDHPNTLYQEYWFRGQWFDNVTMFYNEFFSFGPMKNRIYKQVKRKHRDTSTLSAQVSLEPGERKDIRFTISWYVPNYYKYWAKTAPFKIPRWKNYYAKLFTHSSHVADYCFTNWKKLIQETTQFKDALFSSNLPAPVLDAIQGNLATLKTTTCLRLTNGEFYGWEGVNKTTGSCEGTCQHVWNYAYALPFLFPDLERSIRDVEMQHNLSKKGLLHFRTMLPLGRRKQFFRACVDGQMGTVMKFYREWKICGDTLWLKKHWSNIKKIIEYAWSSSNPDKWDIDKTGVLWGRQHHTLDVELFGPNAWLTGFYHGALLAGAEMAEALGELRVAERYRKLYQKGHIWVEEKLFNGNHYVQHIDITSKTSQIPAKYWDNETKEVKYQIKDGCEIDQVVADWHADLMGLSHIFDQTQRRKALQSIYRLNYKSMRNVINPCRVYACNDEKGVLICAWEKNDQKPAIPIPYTEECMTGFEYAVACNMLQCDMEEEALEIVTAIRHRYDGKKRNPWAEIECGASYARAMASYSLLLTYSGFSYDLTKGQIGFQPKREGSYFWSIHNAWGVVETTSKSLLLTLLYGTLPLHTVTHPLQDVSEVTVNGEPVAYKQQHQSVNIDDTVLKKGDSLHIIRE